MAHELLEVAKKGMEFNGLCYERIGKIGLNTDKKKTHNFLTGKLASTQHKKSKLVIANASLLIEIA